LVILRGFASKHRECKRAAKEGLLLTEEKDSQAEVLMDKRTIMQGEEEEASSRLDIRIGWGKVANLTNHGRRRRR
jgi:hypothetical protein